MALINLGEANRQLTKVEYSLFFSSEPRQIKNLTEKEIKSRIERLTKRIERIKTKKESTNRVRKASGVAADFKSVIKTKAKYFREAVKRFKVELKERKKSGVEHEEKKAIPKKKHLPNEINTKITKQNLKADVKKAPVKKSAIETKVAHQSSRVRRAEGKKDAA